MCFCVIGVSVLVDKECISMSLVFQCWCTKSMFQCPGCFSVCEQRACFSVRGVSVLVNKEHVSVSVVFQCW